MGAVESTLFYALPSSALGPLNILSKLSFYRFLAHDRVKTLSNLNTKKDFFDGISI
jgi:hypothetical protein